MRKLAGAALAVVAVLAGCGGTANRFELSALPAGSQIGQPQVLWRASAGPGDGFDLEPLVTTDTIVVAAANGTLTRFSMSGERAWQFSVAETLNSGVGGNDSRFFVVSERGVVSAYNPDGQKAWENDLRAEVVATAKQADGVMVLRTSDARIVGVDAADGKKRWTFQRALPALTLRANAGVTISRGRVYAGLAGGRLVAISLADGSVVWETLVAVARGTTELERIADVIGVPIVSQTDVCAVAYQGRVGCYDLGRGDAIWSREASSIVGLAGDQTGLYMVAEDDTVIAFDRATGASTWRQEKLRGRRLGAPAVVNGDLVIGDGGGVVHLLRIDSGELHGRIETDGSPISAAPQRIPGGGWVVLTKGGTLLAMTWVN